MTQTEIRCPDCGRVHDDAMHGSADEPYCNGCLAARDDREAGVPAADSMEEV